MRESEERWRGETAARPTKLITRREEGGGEGAGEGAGASGGQREEGEGENEGGGWLATLVAG